MSGIVHWENDDIRSIECSHCHAHFSFDGYKLANFLYGLILLNGKKEGYLGTTCPSCLNTILSKIDRPKYDLYACQLCKGLLSDPTYNYYQFNYSSLVNYDPNDIPGIGVFNIPKPFIKFPSTNDLEYIAQSLNGYTSEFPELDEEYSCSYRPTINPPMGPMLAVYWFKNDEIEAITSFENRNGLKVFPRYYHKIELIEQVEWFCWKYGLKNEFLSKMKKKAEESAQRRSDIYERHYDDLKMQNIDLEKLRETNIVVASNKIDMLDLVKESDTTEKWDIFADFLSILVADSDPFPWETEEAHKLKGLIKQRHPLRGFEFTNTFALSDLQNIPTDKGELAHNKIVLDVREISHLRTVQLFLLNEFEHFVEECKTKAQGNNFSYADFWSIKERYLLRLLNSVKEGAYVEPSFDFSINEFDDHYEVIFHGERHLLSRLIGFKRLFYLLEKKYEEISMFEIDQTEGVDPETIFEMSKEAIDFLMDKEKWAEQKGSANQGEVDNAIEKKWGKRVINELVPQIKKYKQLRQDQIIAEQKNDKKTLMQIRVEQKRIQKLISLILYRSSLTDEERERSRLLKNKIDKSIKEAIGSITDRKLRMHFDNAYKYVSREYTFAYKPNPDIDWKIL